MEQHNTWPGWQCVKQIGAGAYGKVYEIEREETGFKSKAALKVISVPASPDEVEAGYNDSLYETREGAQSYFQSQIDRVTTEFAIMAKLKGYTNIVSYDDHMVIPHEDGIGADILIRMELLTPLDRYRREHKLSESEIIKVGVDICSALDVCQKQNPPILHRDIKPANIMVNQTGDFKLGDFGVSKMMENNKSAHTIAGTEPYMAPEVFFGKSYKVTADIYSLGIVLYRLLNNNRNPFLPVEGGLTPQMQEQAKRTRFEGTAVPEPCDGSPGLKRVVLKALSPNPEQRYQTPESFRSALRECQRHSEKQEDHEYPPKPPRSEFASVSITADEARDGCSKVLTLTNGQKIRVNIQSGCADGQQLRVKLPDCNVIVCVSVIGAGKAEEENRSETDADKTVYERPQSAKVTLKKPRTAVLIASAALLVVLVVVGMFWAMTGTRTEQVLDSDGKLTYELVYNRKEQQIKRTKYDSDENVVFCEEYEYDESGNRITETRYDPDGSLNNTVDFVYDAYGKRIKGTQYDPDGNVVAYFDTFSYDDDGVVTSYKIYDESEKLRYLKYVDEDDMPLSAIFYDDDGLITQEQTFDSNGECVEVTDYGYHNGRLEETLVTSASGTFISRTEYEYETDGSYHTEIYDKNQRVIGGCFYDEDGNLTANNTFEYGSNGLASKQISYDADNKLQHETLYFYYDNGYTMFEATFDADQEFMEGTYYARWRYGDIRNTTEIELSKQTGNCIGGKTLDFWLDHDLVVLIDFDEKTAMVQDNYKTGTPYQILSYDINSGQQLQSQFYNRDGSEWE